MLRRSGARCQPVMRPDGWRPSDRSLDARRDEPGVPLRAWASGRVSDPGWDLALDPASDRRRIRRRIGRRRGRRGRIRSGSGVGVGGSAVAVGSGVPPGSRSLPGSRSPPACRSGAACRTRIRPSLSLRPTRPIRGGGRSTDGSGSVARTGARSGRPGPRRRRPSRTGAVRWTRGRSPMVGSGEAFGVSMTVPPRSAATGCPGPPPSTRNATRATTATAPRVSEPDAPGRLLRRSSVADRRGRRRRGIVRVRGSVGQVGAAAVDVAAAGASGSSPAGSGRARGPVVRRRVAGPLAGRLIGPGRRADQRRADPAGSSRRGVRQAERAARQAAAGDLVPAVRAARAPAAGAGMEGGSRRPSRGARNQDRTVRRRPGSSSKRVCRPRHAERTGARAEPWPPR